MSIREKIYELKKFNQILHTTFNPYEPGVARIYLIPPMRLIIRHFYLRT